MLTRKKQMLLKAMMMRFLRLSEIALSIPIHYQKGVAMYNGQFVTELSIKTVKEYFDQLRIKASLTDEERDDFGICKERLISFACNVLSDVVSDDKANADVSNKFTDLVDGAWYLAALLVERDRCAQYNHEFDGLTAAEIFRLYSARDAIEKYKTYGGRLNAGYQNS